MPRPTRSYGRPGTAVISDDWAASHRPVADKTHVDATVELRHPGTSQTWSDAENQMVEAPNPAYWTGAARIQALDTRDQVKVVAGDREVVIRHLVAVTADVTPLVDDLVTVTVVDDAQLEDRSLVVAQITGGSLRFERHLGCSLND